jgi:uncharacterized membrane protein
MGIGGGLGLLVMVGLILGVVLIVVWAAQLAGRRNDDGPLTELRARYARGEIDGEQFEEGRRVLGPTGGAADRHMVGLIGLVLIIGAVLLSMFLGFDGWGDMMGDGRMMQRPTSTP